VKKVLLAGSTGYLGSYIAKELHNRRWFFRAIARNPEKLRSKGVHACDVVQAEVTDPDSIRDCCADIDVVISTVGITRQKDGLTYKDVDYQANLNILKEAQKSGVSKFIYISVLNGERLRHLKGCDAKEMFVDRLKESGMDYCVIRPNGFFSDMTELYTMAKKGRVYLFGGGRRRANPIHGEDLATFCVDAIDRPEKEIDIGGPETLSHTEMAEVAFTVLGTKQRITHIPEWARIATLNLIRLCTGSTIYGPVEFFMTVMAMDMLAPEYGTHTLRNYFSTLGKPEK
jgi:uncharacterized protein YbjT (DUF2867 family)